MVSVMGKKFSNEQLEILRSIPLTDALDQLGLFWKADRDYKPRGAKEGKRYFVSMDEKVFELQVTGMKWFDMQTKKGGGGAIDLVMYLYDVDFVAAVKKLLHLPKKGL